MTNSSTYAMNLSEKPSRSLLLVDDEPLILESFGLLLRAHLSCPVHTFSSPQEALQKVISLNPGMIISDYLMPGMNGLKFLTQAQRFVPEAHFIIITGGAVDFETQELELLPSLKGIVRKPLHWRKIAELVVENWPDSSPPSVRDTTSIKAPAPRQLPASSAQPAS